MVVSVVGRWRRARARKAAACWMARMHGPEAFRWRGHFEDWRRRHPENAQAYDRQQQIWLVAPGLSAPAAAVPRPTPVFAHAMAASVILVAFGLAAATSWWWREPTPLLIAAQPDQMLWKRLADGSDVLLSDGSRLEVAFDAGNRRLTLTRGRARLRLQPGATPVLLRAGPALVRTQAARIDVAVDRGDARVILLGGSLRLARFDIDDRTSSVLLERGDVIDVPGRGALKRPRKASAADLAWPIAMIRFDDASLSEVLALANEVALTPIEVADPALGALKVTGAYRMGDNEGLARSLAASLRLDVAIGRNGAVMLSRQAR